MAPIRKRRKIPGFGLEILQIDHVQHRAKTLQAKDHIPRMKSNTLGSR
jgi:hypothetical protein